LTPVAYEARTLLGLGVSRCWTRVSVQHRHMIMRFSQIISGVGVSMSMSCPMSMSMCVSVLHSRWQFDEIK